MRKKIFKTILFVILLCLILQAVSFVYKYFWFSKLIKASEDLVASGNFTQTYKMAGVEYDSETGEKQVHYTTTTVKIKDGKKAYIHYDDNGEIASKTYYIGNTGTMSVYDSEKEFEYYTSSSLSFLNDIYLENYPIFMMKSYSAFYYVPEDYKMSLREKLWCMSVNFDKINRQEIYFVTEDGKDYIVLRSGGERDYFDKETLLAVKTVVEGNTYALNGENEYVNYYYEYTQGDVTDEDMTVPDLTGYTQVVNGWNEK